MTAPSVCVHCGVGCNTIPGERCGTLRRIQNRFNSEVNGYFLCDRGRYGYEFVNSEKRIRNPMYRRPDSVGDGAMAEMKGGDVIQRISAFVLPGASDIIGIGSPRASCESNFALLKLVGRENFYSGLRSRDQSLVTSILQILAESPARVPSLKDVEECDAVFIIGEDISNTAPRLALALHRSVRQKPMEIARRLHIPDWDDAAVREAVHDERGPLFIATPHSTRHLIPPVLTHLPLRRSVKLLMT
jgi:NADH-quinone oxidoreductase subunit G